ncbi:MAG: glycosyltransferase family 2 protein [Acidobacteria bacterium]|nr:glycosyltransferase family 2 protein [Acidobacteriota bacterium]
MIVAAVIPALDEEAAIADVVEGIDRTLVRDVIVADNGSTDRTADVALKAGARVVPAPSRGYGAACWAAIEALRDDVEIVVFIDGDGSVDLDSLPPLLDPLLRNQADLAIGWRSPELTEPGAVSPQQRIGNTIAVALIQLLYHHRYHDLGPFRAIRRSLLDRIGMKDRGYGWTAEMQVRALHENARVVEVQVRTKRRIGRSKISGTIPGILRAARGIIGTILRLRNNR